MKDKSGRDKDRKELLEECLCKTTEGAVIVGCLAVLLLPLTFLCMLATILELFVEESEKKETDK
jgi:hypothetical protein